MIRTYLLTLHTTVLRPFFRDHSGEPVPEENFWTLWCKGRLTEADTLTIRLGATPSGLTSVHLHHPPIFLWAGCPSCRPTNSVKALKANELTYLLRPFSVDCYDWCSRRGLGTIITRLGPSLLNKCNKGRCTYRYTAASRS